MGDGGSTENTDGPEPDNVIRFPRDWFGSKDDLVPFGPAADRLAAAAAAAEADQADAAHLAEALTAHDFWGAGAGALHQPVGVPEVAEPPVTAAATRPRVHAVQTSTGPVEPASPVFGAFDAAEPPLWSRTERLPVTAPRRQLALPARGWLSGLAVAVMLICGVGVFLLSRAHATPAAAHQSAASSSVRVTPGVSVSEAADRLAVQGLREAGRVAAQATRSSELVTHRSATRRASTARRTARHTVTTAVSGGASHSAAASQTAAVSQPTAVSASSETTAVAADPSSVDSAASTDSATSNRTPTASRASTRKPATSKSTKPSSTSSSTSASLGPGPTTAGSAGPNCDPQCQ